MQDRIESEAGSHSHPAESHGPDKSLTSRKNPLYKRDCVKCGCPLSFGRTHEGKLVPLDLRSHVYAVVYDRGDPGDIAVVRTELCYVSHYATCKFADEFSKKNKKDTMEVSRKL